MNKGVNIIIYSLLSLWHTHKTNHTYFPPFKLVLKGLGDVYTSDEYVGEYILNLKGLYILPDEDVIINEFVTQCIRYTPSTMTFEELNILYNAADVYISPYVAEGFNIPVLEAIAVGLPVIVSDYGPNGGGTSEYVNDIITHMPYAESLGFITRIPRDSEQVKIGKHSVQQVIDNIHVLSSTIQENIHKILAIKYMYRRRRSYRRSLEIGDEGLGGGRSRDGGKEGKGGGEGEGEEGNDNEGCPQNVDVNQEILQLLSNSNINSNTNNNNNNHGIDVNANVNVDAGNSLGLGLGLDMQMRTKVESLINSTIYRKLWKCYHKKLSSYIQSNMSWDAIVKELMFILMRIHMQHQQQQ